MKNSIIVSLLALLAVFATACIEDGFTTSPSSQPTFSVDTLKMGEVFTLDGTPTKRFTVHNRHDKMLSISSIALRDDSDGYFRLNVDGVSGRDFSDVEIRPKDSIFVFVEATLPENGEFKPVNVKSHLDFLTNGVTQTVVLSVDGIDVTRLDALTVERGEYVLTADRPYVVFDTLRVEKGATLRIAPGAKIHFHDKAAMKINGTLVSRGTPDKNIEMIGDRSGNVAASIPYELMSGQWGGLYFGPDSKDNMLSYTSIRNSTDGLTFATPAEPSTTDYTAKIVNCQIRNTKNYIIDASHVNLYMVGNEFADASNGILHLVGGSHLVAQSTIANYYLFTALGGPAIQFGHIDAKSDDQSGLPYLAAAFDNCIIYGNGTDLSHGDLTGMSIRFRRCLFHADGTDDDNFIRCIWNEDPLYYTVRSDYHFDYRLKPDSPAIGAADDFPSEANWEWPADRYGVATPAPGPLGAYNFVAPEK